MSAEHYAGRGELAEMDLDTTDLRVVVVKEYDREENLAPGDEDLDKWAEVADVLVYEDEDPFGREHTAYRLVTQAAVDAVKLVSVM